MDFSPLWEGVWGALMLRAMGMTLLVACLAFLFGQAVGLGLTLAQLSGARVLARPAQVYGTIVRGVPELLIIYLIFFGGSNTLGWFAAWFGHRGYIEISPMATGVVAIGMICGAYSSEVLRGAIAAVPRGQVEAATAFGMSRFKRARRITGPLALRYALPGLGNIWLTTIKETSLISVVGLVEIMRQAGIAGASTRQPFTYYVVAAAIYLLLTGGSVLALGRVERLFGRGTVARRA
ncbi:ABC transporter permease subunit [Mesorhizobium sp. SP-1A]|uniref:ABC transporter permease n=1 Tax=Mesorhizobium sp. SP-1A TaxID=3077840 RepID=UPI0028F711CD|nr:ABC transporter permease subunit [Mesorhizobium sp. SP-1A]